MSPAALNIARGCPRRSTNAARCSGVLPVHQNEKQIPVRVDFQANQQQSFVGRYMLTTDDLKVPFDAGGRQPPGHRRTGSDDRAHNLTVGHTWVISPTMVNSFRVLGNDVDANKPGPQFFSPQDVGINAYTSVPGYAGSSSTAPSASAAARSVEPLRQDPERAA